MYERKSTLIYNNVSLLLQQDPLRAVVMADRLILIVPDGADSLLSILDKYMHEWVSFCAHINVFDLRMYA